MNYFQPFSLNENDVFVSSRTDDNLNTNTIEYWLVLVIALVGIGNQYFGGSSFFNSVLGLDKYRNISPRIYDIPLISMVLTVL